MKNKKFLHKYKVASTNQSDLGRELDIVGNAYEYAGWREVDFIPSHGIPEYIVFEWIGTDAPVYPFIDNSLFLR